MISPAPPPPLESKKSILEENFHDFLFTQAKKTKSRVPLKKIFLYNHRAQNGSWIMRVTVSEYAQSFACKRKFMRYVTGERTREFIIKTLALHGIAIAT